MSSWLSCAVALAGLLLVPSMSPAQSRSVRGYVTYGGVSLASSATFEAVAGTSHVASVGGGIQVAGVWRSLFIDVGVSRQSIDGSRVFVSDGAVFRLDIPVDISLAPVDLVVGWRSARQRFSPYVGGGASLVSYRETSPFSQSGDDVKERARGAVLLAGADLHMRKFVWVGGELRYRAVAGVLGEGGASEAFGEDQLGGLQYSIRVSIGR
jgi:Outer membrane protein beta-barrel domain